VPGREVRGERRGKGSGLDRGLRTAGGAGAGGDGEARVGGGEDQAVGLGQKGDAGEEDHPPRGDAQDWRAGGGEGAQVARVELAEGGGGEGAALVRAGKGRGGGGVWRQIACEGVSGSEVTAR
jgi:hypothetical protein